MINLDDFSLFIQKLEERDEDPKKEIEKLKLKFQQEIINLQRKYEAQIEEEKEKAFNEGFKEGVSVTEKKLTAEFEERIKRAVEEKNAELERINEEIERKIRKIELEVKEALKNLLNSILDNLSEILDYLYISEINKPYLERVIKELIRSFEGEEFLSIEAGNGLYEYLKNKGLAVKKDENLGSCDFRLKFKDFEIESIVSEKLKNLREELEKEIKKPT